MSGTELAETRAFDRFRRKISRAIGPAGIFFKGFLKHPVMVGSIIPSSRFTIDKMLDPVDWDQCRLFVEYGPGVGTFSQAILSRLRRDGCYVAIDTNPDFIDYLRRTIPDGRFSPVLGSAADVEEIVKAHGFQQADYVLSGLPFSTLPDGVGPAIADATWRVIRKDGAFLVYQFSAKARDYMARNFRRIDQDWEVLNIPPVRLFWGWKD